MGISFEFHIIFLDLSSGKIAKGAIKSGFLAEKSISFKLVNAVIWPFPFKKVHRINLSKNIDGPLKNPFVKLANTCSFDFLVSNSYEKISDVKRLKLGLTIFMEFVLVKSEGMSVV